MTVVWGVGRATALSNAVYTITARIATNSEYTIDYAIPYLSNQTTGGLTYLYIKRAGIRVIVQQSGQWRRGFAFLRVFHVVSSRRLGVGGWQLSCWTCS